jgi:hypothetical protein
MAVSPIIEVGTKQPNPFLGFPKYAPVRGDAGKNPSGWSYGGDGNYVKPFRSFSQKVVDANYSLGPYCRQLGGESGRLTISTLSPSTGELGYVQQCWYGFEDGPYNTDNNNVQYKSKAEWWNSETKKVVIQVRDLMTEGHPLINVEVAYASDASDSEDGWDLLEQIKLLTQQILSILDAPDYGTCGEGSKSPFQSAGFIFRDAGWLIGGVPSSFKFLFGKPGDDGNPFKDLVSGLHDRITSNGDPTGLTDPGNPLNLFDLLNDITNGIGEKFDQFNDFISNLTNALENSVIQTDPAQQIDNLLVGINDGANLFINGYVFPNLSSLQGINVPGSSLNNPYLWRPWDYVQQRIASTLANVGPLDNDTILKDYGNPFASDNKHGWSEFLTLGPGRDRNNDAIKPYVDPKTNELVIPEVYGFARGNSIAITDNFINLIETNFGKSTADSVGTLLDMSPVSPFFVATFIPVATLESIGALKKIDKGQTPNTLGGIPVNNLDGLDNTYFETRISAKNLKEGKPELYDYLVNFSGEMKGVD